MQLHPEYSVITNQTLHNLFVKVPTFLRRISAALSVLKLCYKCPPAAATHDRMSLSK